MKYINPEMQTPSIINTKKGINGTQAKTKSEAKLMMTVDSKIYGKRTYLPSFQQRFGNFRKENKFYRIKRNNETVMN